MDLSTIEGLSDEQREAVLALHSKETEGLKANRDTLLEEKREATRLAEESAAKAKAEAEKAAIAEAKKAGDLKALEQSLAEQSASKEAALNAELDKYKGLVLGGKRDAEIAELSGMFASPEAGKMLLGQMVEVSPSDNGTVTTFKDASGNVISTDRKVFADWLKGQEAFKSLIKGVDSAGGGANGGTSGNGGAGTSTDPRSKKIAEINAKFNR